MRFIPQPWGKPTYQWMQAPRVLVSNRAEVDALFAKNVLPGEPSPPPQKKSKRGDA